MRRSSSASQRCGASLVTQNVRLRHESQASILVDSRSGRSRPAHETRMHLRVSEGYGFWMRRGREDVVSADQSAWQPIILAAALVVVSAAPAVAQAPGSTLALRRAEAVTLFGGRLDSLRVAQRKIDGDRERYAAACAQRVTRGRAVRFGAPAGSGSSTLVIENEGTPECRMLAHDIQAQSAAVKTALAAVDEDARRRGIYPGVMRDLRAQYGLANP